MTIKKDAKKSRSIYLLPTVFTLSALFAGFYAVVAAMKGHFSHAAIAIFVAMVMDMLDGRVARMTDTQSAFGAQLDSLSDMVSFGVAPAFVVYSWSLNNLGNVGWLSSFIFMAATALRLARFNSRPGEGIDKRHFRGLPSPAGAGTLAGLVWVIDKLTVNGHSISLLVAMFTVFIGALMVTNVRYRSFKDFDLKGRVSFMVILTLVLVLVLVSIYPPAVLFMIFLGYTLSGPLVSIWRRLRKRVS